MNIRHKYLLLLIAILSCGISSCYKYSKDLDYGALQGTLLDKVTNKPIDNVIGVVLLTPGQSVNGAMRVDTAGNFTNTRILPGAYTATASLTNGCYFPAASDSTQITAVPGGSVAVNLKITPWISISNSVIGVTDSSVTIQYTMQGNNGLQPARHAIFYNSTGNVSASSYDQRPFFTTPAGDGNGTFTQTVTGLTKNTTYYMVVGARISTDPLNPGDPANPSNNYNQGTQLKVTTLP